MAKEGANKQVISSQADSLIKISRIWADFFPANTSNQPIWLFCKVSDVAAFCLIQRPYISKTLL
ncbi:hypothetical protein, partial [Shigella sonnei]|uniref:hypothetical protein n=1 Tax=Shigella sonnei TaxID=624 RepID=UPI001C0A7ACA